VTAFLSAAGRGIVRSLGNLQRRPLRAALATGAIAVALLLVGAVYLAARNVDGATAGLGRGVQMVVYLEEDITAERAQLIADALREVPAVEGVEQVTPEQAFERLRGSLGEHDELIAGVEVGMLPASLEIVLREGVRDVAAAHPLVERLRVTDGVEEVELLGGWVDRVAALSSALRTAGWFLFALVGLACIYTIAVTMRLSMRSRDRQAEVETLEFLGATDRFVRAPMIVEGDNAIIISDIIMPEIDGYEFCRRIKADESTRDIPVMLWTVLSQEGVASIIIPGLAIMILKSTSLSRKDCCCIWRLSDWLNGS